MTGYVPEWTVEYGYHSPRDYSGPTDEWWDVTDGKRRYRARKEEDAKWLCDLLNSIWG